MIMGMSTFFIYVAISLLLFSYNYVYLVVSKMMSYLHHFL
jgi:hypothetical protein